MCILCMYIYIYRDSAICLIVCSQHNGQRLNNDHGCLTYKHKAFSFHEQPLVPEPKLVGLVSALVVILSTT